MKMRFATLLVEVLTFAGAFQAAEPLRQVQTIPLPGVEGRIDHMSVDVQTQRLFVAALGNNTLEVLDLRAGKLLTSITGLREPQGVFFVARENKLFVANGDDGTCRIFDGSSFKLLQTAHFQSDADNVRYDAAPNQIYVGYGEGALGVLDAATSKKLADIALRAHPESFRLEESGPRIFVNLPNANHTIAVVDRSKRSVVATWQLEAQANFPMALDEADHRLLVVTRRPPLLVVLKLPRRHDLALLSIDHFDRGGFWNIGKNPPTSFFDRDTLRAGGECNFITSTPQSLANVCLTPPRQICLGSRRRHLLPLFPFAHCR